MSGIDSSLNYGKFTQMMNDFDKYIEYEGIFLQQAENIFNNLNPEFFRPNQEVVSFKTHKDSSLKLKSVHFINGDIWINMVYRPSENDQYVNFICAWSIIEDFLQVDENGGYNQSMRKELIKKLKKRLSESINVIESSASTDPLAIPLNLSMA